jgi:nucleoside-diphosphate-sugar epimerase
MKVLVTGHDGYVGSVLVPLLLDAGHEITGLDTRLFRGCSLGDAPPAVGAMELDVRDVEPEQLEGFDAICHLAAVSNDPLGDLNPDCTYDVNWRASARLARIAKAAGVRRFVFSSSCSLYGAAGDGIIDEDARLNPVTPYGESKAFAEERIARLADESFTPTFLRNATAYGVSHRHRGDLVLNDLVALALTTGEVRLQSDGSAWRPLVHVEDIARAFLAVLEAPAENVSGRAFNVGRDDDNYTVRQIAEMVRDAVPGSAVTLADGARADRRSYRVSFRAIADALPGFRPRWTVRAGMLELVRAYTSAGITHDDIAGSRFKRILRVRELQESGWLTQDLRWWVGPPPGLESQIEMQEVT